MTYPAPSAGAAVLAPIVTGAMPVITNFFISGTGRVGDPLTANYIVTGNPTPIVTFQWKQTGGIGFMAIGSTFVVM